MNLEGASQEITTTPEPARVIVTDVNISFSNLVGLMVKCVFAAIPAAIIVVFVAVAIGAFFRGLAGS